MKTSTLNKLSKEAREKVIELEGQLREKQEERKEIDKQIENLDRIEKGDIRLFK